MIHRIGLAFVLLLAGCGEREGERGSVGSPQSGEGSDTGRSPDSANGRGLRTPDGDLPTILFIGTSLTAGYGLELDLAFPALIQRRFDSLGLSWRVINAGVSGETSSGALRRLDGLLGPAVRVVVLETGANDGLRGLPPDSTRANLEAIVGRIRGRDATIAIVLAGMEAPPNLGPRFTERFRAVFPDVAARLDLALVPFLLEGVGGVDTLNQADGIHPTARGHRIVADNVWSVLAPLLGRASR